MKTILWCLVIALFSSFCYAQRDTVIVRPDAHQRCPAKSEHGNHHLQPVQWASTPIPRLEWSELGPVTKLPQAATKPDFPDTTIAYLRWYWTALEPEQGKFAGTSSISLLQEARAHGQTLAIRLMPYSNKDPLPEWYQNSGARRANKPTDKDGAIWQPDFSDPLFLKYWGELVAEAGKRYDGNPYLDSVDISSVGYWGEGWSPYMPAFQYQKALIDIWFDAFPDHDAADEFRRTAGAHLWNEPRRRMAAGLSRRSACEIRQSLFRTGDAGYLSAAGRAVGYPGCLAKTSGVAGSVRHGF